MASDIEPYFVLHPLPYSHFDFGKGGHHKSHDWKKSQKKIRRERRQKGSKRHGK